RGDDRFLFGDLDVRAGAAVPARAGMEVFAVGADVGGDRAGVHIAGRADQRDLQRGAAVFPDRAGICAAGDPVADEGGRLERDGVATAAAHDARLAVHGARLSEPDGGGSLRPDGG